MHGHYESPQKRTFGLHFIVTLSMLAPIAGGMAQTVEPRQIAAHGDIYFSDPNRPPELRAPNESVIAAGPDRVMCIFNAGPPQFNPPRRIGFSVAYHTPLPNDPDNWSWTEEWITPTEPPFVEHIDPSLIHVPDQDNPNATGRFVATALSRNSLGILWSYYPAPAPDAPNGIGFSRWYNFQPEPFAGTGMDKPWLVLGEHSSTVEEHYVFWFEETCYGYIRAINAQESDPNDIVWGGSAVYLNDDPNQLVTGVFCAQPTVHADSPLYVAYKPDETKIRFLKGIDTIDPNGLPALSFREILPYWQRTRLSMLLFQTSTVNLYTGNVRGHVPGAFIKLKTTPQFAIDPTDYRNLYVVYHDTVGVIPDPEPDDVDVDVFLQRLRVAVDPNDPYATGGVLGPRIRVNQDNTVHVSDQFTPTLMVDSQGRIHVTFYDDRNYAGQIDGDDEAYFDVYHAVMDEYSAVNPVWVETRLPHNPSNPGDPNSWAFDATRFIDGPREYQGICEDPYRGWIWTAYTGTNINEPDLTEFDTVIYTNHWEATPAVEPQ